MPRLVLQTWARLHKKAHAWQCCQSSHLLKQPWERMAGEGSLGHCTCECHHSQAAFFQLGCAHLLLTPHHWGTNWWGRSHQRPPREFHSKTFLAQHNSTMLTQNNTWALTPVAPRKASWASMDTGTASKENFSPGRRTKSGATRPTHANIAKRPCFSSASRKYGTSSVFFEKPRGQTRSDPMHHQHLASSKATHPHPPPQKK